MEEILASIRRIISEDGDKPAAPAAAPAPPAKPAAAPAKPPPPPPPPPPPAAESPVAAEEDVLELTEVAPEPPAAAPPPPAPEPAPAMAAEEGLVSSGTASAAASSFASLAALGAQQTVSANMAIGNGSRTIEDVVRELLRPMLRTWLDEHLPGMVERMVRAEIERLARR